MINNISIMEQSTLDRKIAETQWWANASRDNADWFYLISFIRYWVEGKWNISSKHNTSLVLNHSTYSLLMIVIITEVSRCDWSTNTIEFNLIILQNSLHIL